MPLHFPAVIEQIELKIKTLDFGLSPNELYEPLRYLMQLGGKRMRPFLTILGYYAFQNDWEKVLTPAVAVEVFHNFTLMHDDIMDDAPLRRGQPTVHEKWNPNTAILAGDVMLVKAYELLAQVDNQYFMPIFQRFNQCATEVCEGQQKDMNFEIRHQVSEDEYLDMIRQKTSVLLGFALEIGAILAGATEKNQKLIRNFGLNLGIGFQIKDDLLDVYGDAQKFGKQIGGDIIANKKTFLLIQALQNAKNETAEQLKHWLALENFDKLEKIQAITQIYNQLEIRTLTEEKMNNYFQKSFEALAQMDLDDEKRIVLKTFAEQIIYRDK